MHLKRDKKDQLYIEWMIGKNGGYKRAWIQCRDPEKDWAKTPGRRYLNVVRVDGYDIGPAGNATDFPIYSDMSDEQILLSFVTAVTAITGCKLSVEDILPE